MFAQKLHKKHMGHFLPQSLPTEGTNHTDADFEMLATWTMGKIQLCGFKPSSLWSIMKVLEILYNSL